MDSSALFNLSYGLYVIGVEGTNGVFAGCIVDALMQASSGDTPRVILSCMKNNKTPELIEKHGRFSVSVLNSDADPFIIADFGFQSSRDADKWAHVEHGELSGLPVLTQCSAHLICNVEKTDYYDTHTVFTCTVTEAQNVIKGTPLLYSDYHSKLKKPAADAFAQFKETGTPPPVSEVQTAEQSPKITEAKEKWVCSVCGYEYDGEIPFEELPDTWTCPLCGVPKNMFKKV